MNHFYGSWNGTGYTKAMAAFSYARPNALKCDDFVAGQLPMKP